MSYYAWTFPTVSTRDGIQRPCQCSQLTVLCRGSASWVVGSSQGVSGQLLASASSFLHSTNTPWKASQHMSGAGLQGKLSALHTTLPH